MSEIPESWAAIVARAWSDEAFRAELVSSPKQTLIESGWQIGDELDVEILEGDGQSLLRLCLPDKPEDLDVSHLAGLQLDKPQPAFCCKCLC